MTLSPADRSALMSHLRKRGETWPPHLVEVPESEWPRPGLGREYPRALWRSRYYLAALYAVPAFMGVEVRRLTVNRVTLGRDGRWDAGIPWEDLQLCKRETGHGDWYGVEIYPRDRDIVDVANMRHLWLLAEPLGIGWFEKRSAP